jgi:hypothetical protein
MLWMKSVYGDDAAGGLRKALRRVLTVTPGWSESYGLFTSGEAPMVLSYTTSPAYHMIAEDTDRYQAAAFSEGHYMQIEVAGMTTNAPETIRWPPVPWLHDHARPSRTIIPTNQLDAAGRTDHGTARSRLRHAGLGRNGHSSIRQRKWPKTAPPGSMNGSAP